MGLLGDLWERIKEKRMNDREGVEDIPDDVTTDKVLRGLRRQRRVQLEELEKEQLRKNIKEYNKWRSRRHLWGFKDSDKGFGEDGILGKKVREESHNRSILNPDFDILKGKNPRRRKKESFL